MTKQPVPVAPRFEAMVSLLLLIALVAGVTALWFPATRALVPPCLFLRATGLYCPGCGSARTIMALLGGDVGTALRMNVLLVALGPFALYALAADVMSRMGVRWLPRLVLGPRMVQAAAIVVLAFWVLRNLPWAPFSWLAPG